MSRILGVDYGTKRVGLAIADPLGMFVRPVGTFSPADAIKELKRVHADEGITTLVVGWPLELDDTAGAATETVDKFIHRILSQIGRVEIVRQDERYTSEEAKDRISRGPDPSLKGKKRGRLDSLAAAIILEDYLSSDKPQTL